MTNEVFAFDGNDTRRIFETVDIVLGTQSGQGSTARASDVALPVVVKPVDTLIMLASFMTSQFDVTLWTLAGDEWQDLKTAEPVRLVTNGKQIALPFAGV